MDMPSFARQALGTVGQAAAFVFERFVCRPLRGLATAAEGLALVLPDLAQATAAAAHRAVSAQLSVAGRVRVRHGLCLLRSGLGQMAWPTGLVVAFLVCRLPGGIWILSLATLLFLAAELQVSGAVGNNGCVTGVYARP